MPSSWSLAAFSWTHRRDASNPLLQPTFHVTSTRRKTPSLPSVVEVQDEHPRGHPLRSLLPLADGGRRCTCSSRFENPDWTLHRAAFAGVSWPRALQRPLQIDVSTSTTMGRSSIPCRDKQQGWLPLSIDRCLSIDGCRRRSSGSGVEDHRASTFPPGIAPEKDLALTPIASDTSCRGHCLSPCLESTRVTGEAAGAAGANKTRAAGGRCAARFPRGNPMSSRPRCLPSQGRPRT